MEKMDSVKDCGHRKIYSKTFTTLTCDPPIDQKPWICQLCGAEGIDRITRAAPPDHYDSLRAKKARGDFKEK